MSRIKWFFLFFLRYYRNMGLRVALYAALALIVAFVSPIVSTWVNRFISVDMTFETVMPVLTILASSMLAVSTFSLNIMVSAHRSAAGATTPRVHRILLEDTTTQSVLATFIGAFVYSLGSIILYRSRFYADDVAVIVMGVTIIVVVLVVVSLLRWIDHLKDLGSVDESIRLATSRAREALLEFAEEPGFGARQLSDDVILPDRLTTLPAPRSGFLQIIDVAKLDACLPKASAIYIPVHPGDHLLEGRPLASVSGTVGEDVLSELADAFTIGDHRTHEQDTEFGLRVLAETALRALSPGINDPGTAIQAIHSLTNVLWTYARKAVDSDRPTSPRVYVAFPREADLMDAAFAAIARDGAGTVEVAHALRMSLKSLGDCENAEFAKAADAMARLSLEYAEHAGLLTRELDALRKTHPEQ